MRLRTPQPRGEDASTAIRFGLVIVTVWGAVLAGYTADAERLGRLPTTRSARRWLNRCAVGAFVGTAGTVTARDRAGYPDAEGRSGFDSAML